MKRGRSIFFFLVPCLLLAKSILIAQGELDFHDQYRAIAGQLIGAALVDEGGWTKLTYITTRIGSRMNGSAQLDRAVKWAHDLMKTEGLENPRLQPIKVPHWVRGRESARVIEPVEKSLNILGLGGSVGTPGTGITAPVVVVSSFDELDLIGRSRVKNKIVLFDMPWEGYGRTVKYRTGGAERAAKLGAAAVLVRSITGSSLYTPHTGAMRYDAFTEKIPAAAITVEDAAWIRRTTEAGLPVRVDLRMEARTLPDADSANVMAEIVGRDLPEEVVVMGGHIDSWDVGEGAQDDGVGIIAAWQAVVLMKQLDLRPRRTVRVVLWTDEENSTQGGEGYLAALGKNVNTHVAAIEMDGGAERPIGFGFSLPHSNPNSPAVHQLQQIAGLLEGIGAGSMKPGGGGDDIDPLIRAGVPGLELRTANEHFFDWHHTNADTLDKVNPQEFRRCIASLAVMAYVLADMPGRLSN